MKQFYYVDRVTATLLVHHQITSLKRSFNIYPRADLHFSGLAGLIYVIEIRLVVSCCYSSFHTGEVSDPTHHTFRENP